MRKSLQRIYGMMVRHLFTWTRELEALADSFWWPTFDIFIWGLMTLFIQKYQDVSGVFLSYFLGAIILWMFVYRSQQEMGMTFLREVWDRNMLSVFTTPLTTWEFALSTLALGVFKLTMSAAWMMLLAYLLFSFNIFTIGWYLVPFIINLLVVGWTAGFVINGLVIRFGFRVQSLAWTLVLVLQPFSAVFYPVSILPAWMRPISEALPTSYIFEGMRNVISNGYLDSSYINTAVLLNIFYLTLSILFFHMMFKSAKKSGALVKFS